jgi:hypothetical protein
MLLGKLAAGPIGIERAQSLERSGNPVPQRRRDAIGEAKPRLLAVEIGVRGDRFNAGPSSPGQKGEPGGSFCDTCPGLFAG